MEMDREINANLIEHDAFYYHNNLQKAGKINDLMMQNTPHGTSIVDCAGGFCPRWNAPDLEKGQHTVIGIDQDAHALQHRSDIHLGIQMNLDALPAAVTRNELSGVLATACNSKRLESYRNELRMLFKICAQRSVGRWIFSSCLLAFEPKSVDRLIQMASMNLHPDGRISIFESHRCERVNEVIRAGAEARIPTYPVRDELVVPLITPEQQTLMKKRDLLRRQTSAIDPWQSCMWDLGEFLKNGEIEVVRIAFTRLQNDPPAFAQLQEYPGKIAALGWSDRWVELARKTDAASTQ